MIGCTDNKNNDNNNDKGSGTINQKMTAGSQMRRDEL